MASAGSRVVRAWFRTYLVALTTAVTVTVGGLVGVNYVYDQKLDSIERVDVELTDDTEPGEPANFLLLGSDTREFVETAEAEEAFGSAEEQAGQRSDTIMVVHVDPKARMGLLVSFPRDLLVDIPGIGESKINAAYNDGPQAVVDTIEQNFDIPIHHYLEVDFASFEGIVNAVGGVPVYFDAPARDEKTGLDVAFFGAEYPGCFELDGRVALAYVRSRSYEKNIDGEWIPDNESDLGRIDRQQKFMRRLAAEALAVSLRNPLAANRIADEALAELKADASLSRTDVNKLIQAFRTVDPNDPQSIEMVTFPWNPAPNGADLVPDREAAAPLLERLKTFEPPAVPEDGPPPSAIRVAVLNGSDVDGAAADADAALREHGFPSGGIGNTQSLSETEVRYRPGSEDKARVVRSILGGDVGTLIEDDTIVEADVALMIGSDFDGVAPVLDAAPPAPESETTAAPAPETEATTEPPEGTEEGTEGEAPVADC